MTSALLALAVVHLAQVMILLIGLPHFSLSVLPKNYAPYSYLFSSWSSIHFLECHWTKTSHVMHSIQQTWGPH